MWVQSFNVFGRKINFFCSTLVEVGCNNSVKARMLLIIAEKEAFWFSCVGEIRSPGSRKHCPNNNSAELPCISYLNMVLSERIMEDK